MKHTNIWVATILSAAMATPVFALPALQLGPDTTNSSDWSYSEVDDTWYFTGTQPFTLNTYANASTANASGKYAWDDAGSTDQYAYLVAATTPDLGAGDKFDITFTDNSNFILSMVTSGYGAPPVEDPNSIASHSIYDTYFEVYEFKFDGPIVNIGNTQPPAGLDFGDGYNEAFSVSWTDLTGGSVAGIHFDLFTVTGDGKYIPGGDDNKKLVKAVAPFSHDAQSGPLPPVAPPDENVPEPTSLMLLGLGLLGFVGARRKKS